MSVVLKRTSYVLNLEDPRVLRRVQIVLDFGEALMLKSRHPANISAKELTKVFGNQTSNALGKHLRARILIAHGHYKVGVHPLKYTINHDGYEKLLVLFQEFSKSQLEDAGDQCAKRSVNHSVQVHGTDEM